MNNLFFTLLLSALRVGYTGHFRVIDHDTGQPIVKAQILLVKAGGSEPAFFTSTDKDGFAVREITCPDGVSGLQVSDLTHQYDATTQSCPLPPGDVIVELYSLKSIQTLRYNAEHLASTAPAQAALAYNELCQGVSSKNV
jgi:hypothetical protein